MSSSDKRARIEGAIRALLAELDPDPERDGLRDTPARVARSWGELLSGYSMDPAAILARRFENEERYDQMVVAGPVEFFSTCEHHLLPFHGRAWVGYIPGEKIVGLSKLARLVECFARRLQVQERMTSQIARALEEHLAPRGWAVAVRSRHLCMCARGVRSSTSEMVTTSLGGLLREEASARDEFLSYLREGSR